MIEVRVGHGFDVHRAGDDLQRPFVLGGCVFPGLPGLVGHSDGDAIAHAVADALSAPPGSATSASSFPTPTSRWKASTRSCCCGR